MKRRMSTIGIAAVLLLASFALTAFTTGGEETSVTQSSDGAQIGLQQPLDQGGPSEFNGALTLADGDFDDVEFAPVSDEMIYPQDVSKGVRSWRSEYYYLDPPTRASDAENEADDHDFPNGSKLTSASETIDGTLTYDPDVSGSPDGRDWYKFSVEDINEIAKTVGGVRNVSVELLSYTDSSDGYTGLYEYTYDETSMISEFGDKLEISLLYYDPWAGYTDMGGSEFRFDDQDDTDGWDYRHNWTTNFVTPVNSDGDEDPDGFTNGHTEVGWYYIGIGMNFFIRDQGWSRDAFTVKYSLMIDTRLQEPTDQGSNAQEDALTYGGSEPKHLHSRWNQVDWYKMGGSDSNKIWNVSFTLNRTAASAGWWRANDYLDNWLWTFVVWRNPGEDEEWGTSDDGWTYDYLIMTFAVTGGRFVSNMEQELGFTYRSWDTENMEREVYIGIIMDPVMIRIENEEIIGYYYYAPTYLWNNYTIDINVVEEVPNHSPTLSDLEISSDWPGHETGGHFGTNFYFNITYTDEDNDPPKDLNMVFDPDTPDEVIYDMMQYEVESGDTDYTDGKEYSYMILGEDFEEGPYLIPPVIVVNASDAIPIELIRIPGWSGDFYYNDTLNVWNDDPVYLNPVYDKEEIFTEDIEDSFQLQDVGLVKDPEGSYLGFLVWNETADDWESDYDSDLLSIKVQQDGGIWEALVTPKPDQNGEETVTFKGFDVYSNISGDIRIIVEPVNDLPVVQSVEIEGSIYEVDNSRPEDPIIHLEDQVDVLQNSEIVIEINTIDIDNEASEITYTYKETDDGDWDGPISVDENTGTITLTPNNNDIKKKNSEIVIEVNDGGSIPVTFTIYLDLENVNDPPTIELLPSPKDVYEREDEISILPRITDPDPDASWTVSVNMLEQIDGVDPIVDQLPYTDLQKDLDWTFNENIGRFTMKTDDWMIWNTSSGFNGIIKITVVFEVKDNEDETDTVQIELTLTSDPPPSPELDDIPIPTFTVEETNPDIPGTYGLKVTLKVSGTVSNVFGEVYEPRWEYNGNVISTEEEFEHEFETEGLKIVNLYYEKGDITTEKRSISMNLKEEIVEEEIIGDDDDVGGQNNLLTISIVVIIIILIIAVLIVLFIVMRKKKEPLEADQEYYDETPRLGGRGRSQELGPHSHTRGLSPARESEHSEKLPPKKEGPRMSCPNCGASVQKGWFLCPDCKNPLD